MTNYDNYNYWKHKFELLHQNSLQRPCCAARCYEKLCAGWEQFVPTLKGHWSKDIKKRYQDLKVIISQTLKISAAGRRSFQKHLPYLDDPVCSRTFFWFYGITRDRVNTILRNIQATGASEEFWFKNKSHNPKPNFHDIVAPLVVEWMLDLSADLAEVDPRRDWRVALADNGHVMEYLPPEYGPTKLYREFNRWFEENHKEVHQHLMGIYVNNGKPKPEAISEKAFRKYLKAEEINHIKTRPPKDNVCDKCYMFEQPQGFGESQEHFLRRREAYKEHKTFAEDLRKIRDTVIREARDQRDAWKAGGSKPKMMVLGMDFSQDFLLPYFGKKEPARYFWALKRPVKIFGMVDEASRIQHNFYFADDEGNKGAACTSWMVFCYLRDEVDEDEVSDVETLIIYADNCGGQNKNNTMLKLMAHLVWGKDLVDKFPKLKRVELRFLLPGHTHFSPDRGFTLIKKELRKKQRFDLKDFHEAVHESSDFAKGVHMTEFYDFLPSLNEHYRTLKDFKEYRKFVFVNDNHEDVGYCFQSLDPRTNDTRKVQVVQQEMLRLWRGFADPNQARFPESFEHKIYCPGGKNVVKVEKIERLCSWKRIALWEDYCKHIPEEKRGWLAPTPAARLRDMTKQELKHLPPDDWEVEKCEEYDWAGRLGPDVEPMDISHADDETGAQHGNAESNRQNVRKNQRGEVLAVCINCNEEGHPHSLCLRPSPRKDTCNNFGREDVEE